jgi:RecA/RadA recombinase
MSSENARNIVELRQLLATKFPGVRMSAEKPEVSSETWPTTLPQLDSLLHGGLPKGAITEIVSAGVASGSSLILGTLMQRAQANGKWFALVDGSDSFDPSWVNPESLSRLLWVRCSNAKDAIKATDMLLHDGTLSIVALDLWNQSNSAGKRSLRKSSHPSRKLPRTVL